ncbi:putative E3 ubiquitin-protein ligase herc6, partial [Cladochytrium tenue]
MAPTTIVAVVSAASRSAAVTTSARSAPLHQYLLHHAPRRGLFGGFFRLLPTSLRGGVGADAKQKKPALSPPPRPHIGGAGDSGDWRTLAWGVGGDGRLGIGSAEPRCERPVPIEALDALRVLSISCGVQHSAAVVLPPGERPEDGGHVYGWGSNFFGQAGFMADNRFNTLDGLSSEEDEMDVVEVPSAINALDLSVSSRPAHLSEFERFRTVSCGYFHSVALSTKGRVWTWGAGILGHGNELYDSNAMEVRFFSSVRRRVLQARAAGHATVCLATRAADEDSGGGGGAEVYVWGYLADPSARRKRQRQRRRKACAPVLVADAVRTLVSASSVHISVGGVFAVAGVARHGVTAGGAGHCVRVYGCYDSNMGGGGGEPSYPAYEDVPELERVYEFPAVAVVDLDAAGLVAEDVSQFEYFQGQALIVTRSGDVFVADLPQCEWEYSGAADGDEAVAAVVQPRRVQLPWAVRRVGVSGGPVGVVAACSDGTVRGWRAAAVGELPG